MRKKLKKPVALLMAMTVLLSGCGTREGEASEELATSFPNEMFATQDHVAEEEVKEPMVPLAGEPLATTFQESVASGTVVYYSNQNKDVAIDASNTTDGYVMVRYTGRSTARLKVMIIGPNDIRYIYDLNTGGDYEAFVLSSGSGSYSIGVYQNVGEQKYTTLFTQQISAELKNEYTPFLRPNQYVNYKDTSEVVKIAAELTEGTTSQLKKVQLVYEHVIKNITYDKEKAANVQSGYIPDVDAVLAAKKGICFDYAAVMAAMLRSQGIPTKLVVGYTGSAYHAWISIYTTEAGWIEGVVFFDGVSWRLMDPTFAANGNGSKAVMEYIGNGKNYQEKYLY